MKPWEKYQPVKPSGPWEQYASIASEPEQPKAEQGGLLGSPVGGFVRGLMDIPDAGAQLLRRAVPESVGRAVDEFGNRLADLGLPIERTQGVAGVDALVKSNEEAYQKARQAQGREGMDWGRLAGNLVASAPIATAIPGGAAAKLGTRMASGGATGATLGALSPVTEGDFADQKLKQMTLGGAFGAAAPAVISGVARMVKPNTSAEVQALMKEGVTPTPGQILGGAAKRAEEGLTSVPIIGDAIKTGQRRAVDEFNRAAINRTLAPIGKALPDDVPVGRDAVKFAGETISKAYDDLLPKLNIQADQQFAQEVTNLQTLAQSLPESQAKQFNGILQNDVLSKFTPYGKMMGETMKGVESKLGGLIRSYGRSENPDHRLLSDALKEAQATLRGMVERGNPQYAGELSKVNSAYANLLRVESASGRLGSKDGIFSAAGLTGAVKATDSSLRKRAFARGGALMQDLAESGQKVLGQTVPDSGTPFRTMNALALGTGAYFSPTAATAAVGASTLYTRPVQNALAALLTQRPDFAGPLSQGLRKLGPAGSAVAPLFYETGQR